MEKKNVLIAFGGASPEHEVSVITAHQAIAELKNREEYRLIPLYVSKSGKWFTGEPLMELSNFEDLKKIEAAATPCTFSQNEYGLTVLLEKKKGWLPGKPKETPLHVAVAAFHGSSGENGAFQGVCEMFRLPCTGSGVMGSAIGMDKVTSKTICKAHNIPVVEGVDFFEKEWVDSRAEWIGKIETLGYPVIVKPVHLGSSIGVQIAESREELIHSVEVAFKYDHHLLIEELVKPLMEINCSVLGSSEEVMTSVCERPVGAQELLTFQDKYLSDEGGKGMASAERVIPADIPESLSESIRDCSATIFKLLNCGGLARLDFLVKSGTETFYFNEINTIPGSFSFYLWKESGLGFRELLIKLIDLALEGAQQKNRRIQSYETNLLSTKAVKGIKGLKGTK